MPVLQRSNRPGADTAAAGSGGRLEELDLQALWSQYSYVRVLGIDAGGFVLAPGHAVGNGQIDVRTVYGKLGCVSWSRPEGTGRVSRAVRAVQNASSPCC